MSPEAAGRPAGAAEHTHHHALEADLMLFLPRCCGRRRLPGGRPRPRYSLSCVRVRRSAGCGFRVEATDGRVLGIVHGRPDPTLADLGGPPALTGGAGRFESLVPAAALRTAFRIPPGDWSLGVILGDPVLLAGDGAASCPADLGKPAGPPAGSPRPGLPPSGP
ncbi:MAG: hypothetical protein U0797_06865 [Gemmataceae bacterium]